MYNVFWNKVKEKYPVLLEELSQGLNQLYEQTGNELFTNKEFLALRYSSVLALSNDLIHREQNCFRVKIRLASTGRRTGENFD